MPTDGLLDLAITIVLEWGRDCGRPVTTRLMERAPGVDLPRAEALEAEAQRIKYEAFDLAEATLNYLWSKGRYYAWHG